MKTTGPQNQLKGVQIKKKVFGHKSHDGERKPI